MKSLNEYIIENIETENLHQIDEGVFDMLKNFIQKMFTKKYKVSENGSDELTSKLEENKNNLDNQVYEYTKKKVKTSEDWWKAFLKSDIAKGQKLTDPAVFNKNILQNINNAAIPFKKQLLEFSNIKQLNTPIIQSFIQRDVKDFASAVEIINNENEKAKMKNKTVTKNMLSLLKNIQKEVTDKEAKEVYNESLKTLEDIKF